jgi:hypothetical protein
MRKPESRRQGGRRVGRFSIVIERRACSRKREHGTHERQTEVKRMQIRDRIQDFRRVPAHALRPHPRNWRTHPKAQQDALRGVLAEVGYADALIARELADGSLQLLDGHLRAELTPDALVPVLVVDVDDAEALKLLATLDPLAAMAETDARLLAGLVADVQTDNAALRAMLEDLAEANPLERGVGGREMDEVTLAASYQIVVQCGDESRQRELYERLTAEGWKCRVLAL